MSDDLLVLGPLVRYVDQHSAAVWVETGWDAVVEVRAGERRGARRTFAVHGHHYALVDVDGLPEGAVLPYTVTVDGTEVWPPPDSELPPSRIATLKPGKPLRLAYGSCRTSVAHDAAGHASHGVDALQAYALHMATHPDQRWPDLVLFLGDQVYADETTPAMRAFIASRRDLRASPGTELKDFEEYAELYRLAWTDPANRWLLSTLPSLMIFDDHDIRDDWNTSAAWHDAMRATDWWHGRVVSGLAAYWVYQHLGNLSPLERASDAIWRRVAAYEAVHPPEDRTAGELDLTEALDTLAARADAHPQSYRWSFARGFGGTRLVVVDTRAARVLQEPRSMLDDHELAWLDGQLTGDVDHLFLGSSLPFLLSPGLHHVEAWSEAVAVGAWGRRFRRPVEGLRRLVDLEHWAAFDDTFRTVAALVLEVARGERGRRPRTITFLSGDVHHSYLAEVDPGAAGPDGSRILQAVCSPIRNPLPRSIRLATTALAYDLGARVGRWLARSAGVPAMPFTWRFVERPWYDNNLATVEVADAGLRFWWDTGVVEGGDHGHPRRRRVRSVEFTAPALARSAG